ncbi:MAG: T9SS type A sorting domain-containing protein [Urechidicola sp.]|nr:T9SS type A sorting domain-containing protein [Urechidicola sp.]
MNLLLNTDPIATGFSGVFDSFYNVNLGAGTTDEFLGLTSGMEIIMFSSLSVEDEILNSETNVYPNPSKSRINISSSLDIIKLELFNLLGQKIVESTETSQLDISDFDSGVYILNLYSENGKGIKKIIVE